MQTNTFKMVIVGDSEVGKTSLMRRISTDSYFEAEGPTIGAQF